MNIKNEYVVSNHKENTHLYYIFIILYINRINIPINKGIPGA